MSSSISELLDRVGRTCRRKGFRVEDPEYGSAVNYAVAVALARRPWCPLPLARFLGVRYCINAYRRRLRFLRHPDRVAARPRPYVLPLADFELLELVASVGFRSASRLLMVRRAVLVEWVEEMQRKVSRGS